jgi:hypothetical protein
VSSIPRRAEVHRHPCHFSLRQRSSRYWQWIPAQAQSPTGYRTASIGEVDRKPGSTTAAATGSGTVTVTLFDSDPSSVSLRSQAYGDYFDVYVLRTAVFNAVKIVACDMPGFSEIYWLNGSTWELVTPQSYNTVTGCVTMDFERYQFATISATHRYSVRNCGIQFQWIPLACG